MKKILKNSIYYKKDNINQTIEKRYKILKVIIILLLFIIIMRLFYIQVIQNNYYVKKVKSLTEKTIISSSTPRGLIYDRNYNLIVDNVPVKVIFYEKTNNLTIKEQIDLAYQVANMIDVNYSNITDTNLKEFWIIKNKELANSRILDTEWQQLEERKITVSDIESMRIARVTDDDINSYNELDKEAIYIYNLMNKGYYYSLKEIERGNDVTDVEYANIASNVDNLKGFNVKLDWDREYLYDSTFKGILGSVSNSKNGLPLELKDYYLNKGYSLDDRVGISYIEYIYEDYLKGDKDIYQLLDNNEKKLVKEGKRGNDIVLTIDINLQKAIEEILEEEIRLAKDEPNTKYYNHSFVIISDPNTGDILAMAGKQIINVNGEYQIYDYTPGVATSTVVAGSVVKGASHIVGYNNNALTIGEKRYDNCIKIASTPIKCSWKYLGLIDDISALTMSSNTYQYHTAINVGGGIYNYDSALNLNDNAFDIYRNTFSEFGLGVKTGIDLPTESLGYKGSKREPGLLLDFSIGQYDTYTPLQLTQYINTIASNGIRRKLNLLKGVYSSDTTSLTTLVKEVEPTILNEVNTHQEYIDRVKLGFRSVVTNGTGIGYMYEELNSAGKTGTSESFIDTDGDNYIDTETISHTFVAYAPYDNPEVTFTIVSPDIYDVNGNSDYTSDVNKRIAYKVSKKYFEIYK